MALKLVGSEGWMEEQCWSGMQLLNNGLMAMVKEVLLRDHPIYTVYLYGLLSA